MQVCGGSIGWGVSLGKPAGELRLGDILSLVSALARRVDRGLDPNTKGSRQPLPEESNAHVRQVDPGFRTSRNMRQLRAVSGPGEPGEDHSAGGGSPAHPALPALGSGRPETHEGPDPEDRGLR